MNAPQSIEAWQEALAQVGYLADRRLATTVFLASRLQRPLMLEGVRRETPWSQIGRAHV